jgi:beta-galactosidase
MWLARLYPEINAHRATGQPIGWGARQEIDYTHPAFLFHAERVIRRIVERYAAHPAVIGFQVDNEPGNEILHNRQVFERFVDRLRTTYGTVEALNDEWGLTYWSHRLSTWADLWTPDGNAQPQYDLAWRRFQAGLVIEYIGWQADIVRGIVGPDAFITTCISYEQPGIEDVDLSARLGIASGNAYYEMEEALAHPSVAPRSTGPMGWVLRGPWAVRELADLMWSSRQAPFLVTETNAGAIGFSAMNESPYDGQWRQAAWLLVARGARMVEYWHWNTLPFGAETFWGGVLPHSGEPGRAYREIARLGGELATAGEAFRDAEPEFDATVLWDSDSKFALAAQSPFAPPGAFADPDAYRAIVSAFSRGLFDAKRQERLIRPQQLLPSRGGTAAAVAVAVQHPVLVVAALYTATDDDLDFLVDYAEAGGHLVLGPRAGYGDEEGRARTARQPARLAEAAGAWFDETASLQVPVPLDGLPGAATAMAQLLVADGADVVARYDHPHYGSWAAVTTRAVGAGRITSVGFVPDQIAARAIAERVVPVATDGWTVPEPVTASTSRTADGRRVTVLHNWGWVPTEATSSTDVVDLIDGATAAAGEPVRLAAWDVRVLEHRPSTDHENEEPRP